MGIMFLEDKRSKKSTLNQTSKHKIFTRYSLMTEMTKSTLLGGGVKEVKRNMKFPLREIPGTRKSTPDN